MANPWPDESSRLDANNFFQILSSQRLDVGAVSDLRAVMMVAGLELASYHFKPSD